MAVTLRLVSSIQTLCRIKLSLRSMPFTITEAARKKRRESCGSGLDSSHNVECIWSAEIKGNNLHIFDTLSYIFLVRFLCSDNQFDYCLGWPNMGNKSSDLLGHWSGFSIRHWYLQYVAAPGIKNMKYNS